MGQHRPWKHQVSFGRNLPGRTVKTRRDISPNSNIGSTAGTASKQ
jgi:hypothetical protein